MTSEHKSKIAKDGNSTKPIVVRIISIIVALFAVAALAGTVFAISDGITHTDDPAALMEEEGVTSVTYYPSGFTLVTKEYTYGNSTPPSSITNWQAMVAGIIATVITTFLSIGIWRFKGWARSGVSFILGAAGLYYGMGLIFESFALIFGGESVVPLGQIGNILLSLLIEIIITGAFPGLLLFGLYYYSSYFDDPPAQRKFIDKAIRYLLIASALSSVVIVFLIIFFTMSEAWLSVEEIGLENMLLGTIWRPGSIIGTDDAQFGLLPMIAGSILSTLGAVVLGVPVSISAAILLAEVAPPAVREIVRPSVELLAGIPSVVYGLFGMVVLAPLIRNFEVPYNSGFGLLNASIILAVMLIPTVTNIAEDAIRAVPQAYKLGSLAMGATHWQTIAKVILPAAKSGIFASIILGIGRALGETMAMIMVIGNSIAMPRMLDPGNPLSLFLSAARTLTGNIAVEINYAAGAHRSSLFFTGIILFIMIYLVNSIAHFLMKQSN